MSWATSYIADLQAGKTVSFRPKGNSMTPRIKSGQLVTVEPIALAQLRKNDVVLCKVNGQQYLHLVKAMRNGQVQIGNNKGRINGWTAQVFGKMVANPGEDNDESPSAGNNWD